MAPKRIFRFAYHTSLSDKPGFRIHQLRDGDAFAELSAVLYSRDYEYGGLLLNLPSLKPPAPYPVDVSFLTSSDLIVLNTRPPMDDIEEEDKHLVRRSYTTFEEAIFNKLKPKYFVRCARSHITLSKALAKQLPEGFRDRANMLFHQYASPARVDGSYIAYGEFASESLEPPADQRLTPVFLIQIPALWEGGPGLLAAFGMAGIETMAWNFLLRTQFQDWLEYQFLMAEVLPGELPIKPTNLSFAEDWKVVPILRIPFRKSAAR